MPAYSSTATRRATSLPRRTGRVKWPATALEGALSYPQGNLSITEDPVHAPFTINPTGQISNTVKTLPINDSFLQFATVTNEGHILGLNDPSGWGGLKFEPDTGWWTFDKVYPKWMQWPTIAAMGFVKQGLAVRGC